MLIRLEGDDYKEIRTLLPADILSLFERDEIDFPIITAKDIKDKSKGDFLTKSLVLLQTGWFVLQIIARGIERLPVTELEIATLAFAVLNFITYALWWNKPLNVQRPFPVMQRATIPDSVTPKMSDWETASASSKFATESRFEVVADPLRTLSLVPGSDDSSSFTTNSEAHSISETISSGEHLLPKVHGSADPFLPADRTQRPPRWRKRDIPGRVWVFIVESLGAIRNFVGGDTDSVVRKRVSTFYYGQDAFVTYAVGQNWDISDVSLLVSVVITTLFGSIHCIAWSFQFPSTHEELLWRLSSLVITCSAVIGAFLPIVIAGAFCRDYDDLPVPVHVFLVATESLIPPLYILARATLLVLACMELGSLPLEAYETVYWTTFIPHI